MSDELNKDIEELFKLADDPIAFEERRQQILKANIEQIAERNSDPDHLERLFAYQWRIDQELSKYKDPTARYNKMVEMFWEQFGKFQGALNKIQEPIEEAAPQKDSAEILQFKNPNK